MDRRLTVTAILLALLCSAFVGGYIIYSKRGAPDPALSVWSYPYGGSPQEIAEAVPVPEGWLAYTNKAHHFTLYHPPELVPTEYDEGSGTHTITFEPEGGGWGFQLFVTPYGDDAITQSRILKDIPSGEFTSPQEITLGDGTRALTFESQGPLGTMREVWFLHDAYLFELTGYVELQAHVVEVIRTWSFSTTTAQ